MDRYFQIGSVAAYEHVAMIKMHYRIADALDDCLDALVAGKRQRVMDRRTNDRPSFRLDVHASRESTPMKLVNAGINGSRSIESLSTSSNLDDEDEEGENAKENWEALPSK